MRVIAIVMKREVAERILRHLGLPIEPPRISPPRAPPQGDLFGGGADGNSADPPASDDWAA